MIAPSAAPAQWNHLYVAGKRAPGLVRISGPGLVIGWDIQNPQGMAGGVTVRKGEPVKEFDAEFDLGDEPDAFGDTDFDRWDAFQKMLLASVPPAIPSFGGFSTGSVPTLGSIGQLETDGKGGGKIKVHFIEYRPPRPIGAVKLTKTAGDDKIEGAMAELKATQAALDAAWKAP